MGVTAQVFECLLSCLLLIITCGLLLWVGSTNDPADSKSSQCEKVKTLSPNHGNHEVVEYRSSIGPIKAIEIPTLPIEKDETKSTSGKIIKRNAPPIDKVSHNVMEGIDCDLGPISQERRFDGCLNGQRDCEANELLVLKDLIETGTSIDILYTLKNDPGKLTMDRRGNIYRAHCKKVNVTILQNTKCYAEGLIPIVSNGKQRYIGRANFIIKNAIEIPCQRKSTENEVRAQIEDYLAMAYCVENIVLSMVHRINTKLDVSHIFNPKSVESLLLIQESFTYGYDKDHLLIKVVKCYKKYSPFVILIYTVIYHSHSIVLFFVACARRLPFLTSLSFLFRCFKTHRDLRKYLKIQKTKDEKKERESLRKSMHCEISDADFQAQHIAALYESVVDLNNRLKHLEEIHKPTNQSELSLTQSETQF